MEHSKQTALALVNDHRKALGYVPFDHLDDPHAELERVEDLAQYGIDPWESEAEHKLADVSRLTPEGTIRMTVGELKRVIKESIEPSNTYTPWLLAQYVYENWERLTGLSKNAIHDEGDFPDVIWDLCAQHNIDELEFNDAWVKLLG